MILRLAFDTRPQTVYSSIS